MKSLAVRAVAAGLLCTSMVVRADAIPVPVEQQSDTSITLVADGCGAGWYRGPGGACHRFGYGPGPRWWRGPGPRYFCGTHRAWAPGPYGWGWVWVSNC
jgi:hypothetical protein